MLVTEALAPVNGKMDRRMAERTNERAVEQPPLAYELNSPCYSLSPTSRVNIDWRKAMLRRTASYNHHPIFPRSGTQPLRCYIVIFLLATQCKRKKSTQFSGVSGPFFVFKPGERIKTKNPINFKSVFYSPVFLFYSIQFAVCVCFSVLAT